MQKEMNSLTIVMYHYVRDLKNSRYPEIKGLSVDLFREQIGYLKRHYNPISAYDLMDAIQFKSDLPPQSLLLTFDDAYIDHFSEVYPILQRENLSGCFFPPAKCILDNNVLDVNKIHFILATVEDKSLLVDFIYQALDENRAAHRFEPNEFYWKKCAIESRYDSADIMFVKRMLQRDLPENFRNTLIDKLFSQFVSSDEVSFSQELYMNEKQISCLQNNGMYIGSHGFDHYHLSRLSKEKQKLEIDLSLNFLRMIGSDIERWIMCYPYGDYNQETLSILRNRNCVAGLTTKVNLANLATDEHLLLPRLDTNDLPMWSKSAANSWTTKAISSH